MVRIHSFPIRVYFEDTDIGGVVHHSNYLKFFERGRLEFLRAHGIELSSLYEKFGIHFVIHTIEISYLKPAYLDQLLFVVTQIIEEEKVSLLYNQSIHLNGEEGPRLCTAKIRLVCVNKNLKPCRVPDFLRMERLCGNRTILDQFIS